MSTTTAADKAFIKLAKATEGFELQPHSGTGFAQVYRSREDERHLVVDSRTSKIVKRFRDAETSWSDAARFAGDYYFVHCNEEV